MNFLKVNLGLFSLLAIFAVSVLFTSCEKDIPNAVKSDVNELSALKHSKDLEILSENGLSKATLTVSGNDVSLLNEIKQGDFKIIPIFEQPTETLEQSTNDTNQSISNNTEDTPVAFEVIEVELEEGAIGYTIEVKKTNFSRATGFDYWNSYKNNVKIDRKGGCTRLEVWRQLKSSSNFKYVLNSNSCGWNTTRYHGGNSHKLKTKVSYYNAGYWVTFYN